MVTCSSCGKTLDKIPAWMESIQVTFVCNNCPNRQHKNIAFMQEEFGLSVAQKVPEAVIEPEAVVETEDIAESETD